MPCIRHYVRPQCHAVVIFQYGAACEWHFLRFAHVQWHKTFHFCTRPHTFWHLFEKTTKYFEQIKLVE